jgi:histidinol-phosphate/aromatic aminotransferase/cobyric acid decarboxylase-like protein
VAALSDTSGWAQEMVEMTLENRERLRRELEDRGFEPLPSQANFLLVPVRFGSAVTLNEALRRDGISARPFSGLPEVGEALRVSIGPWVYMERFLAALEDAAPKGPTEENES